MTGKKEVEERMCIGSEGSGSGKRQGESRDKKIEKRGHKKKEERKKSFAEMEGKKWEGTKEEERMGNKENKDGGKDGKKEAKGQ